MSPPPPMLPSIMPESMVPSAIRSPVEGRRSSLWSYFGRSSTASPSEYSLPRFSQAVRDQPPPMPPLPQQPPPYQYPIHPARKLRTPSQRRCSNLKWYLRLTDSAAISMVGLFILGTVFALSHHVFYLSLDGEVVPNEDSMLWSLRGGTVLALLAKSCYGASIRVAHLQWVWLTVSQSSVSVKAMDAMFGVSSDLTRFTNFEMARKGSIATLLATLSWLIPITTVFTPSCLYPRVDPRSLSLTLSDLVIRYRYVAENIYISYGISLLITILCIALGCYAYHQNDCFTPHSFSSILQATRNPILDHVAWDRVNEDDLAEIRLRFSKAEEDGVANNTAGNSPTTRRPTFTLSDASMRQNLPLRAVVRYG